MKQNTRTKPNVGTDLNHKNRAKNIDILPNILSGQLLSPDKVIDGENE